MVFALVMLDSTSFMLMKPASVTSRMVTKELYQTLVLVMILEDLLKKMASVYVMPLMVSLLSMEYANAMFYKG